MQDAEEEIQDKEILMKMIYEKFGTLQLTKQQYSRLINRSVASIDRDRAMSRGACWSQDDNNRVYFPVQSIVSYLLKVQKTLDSE